MATWLIQAHIQLSRLSWIPERIVKLVLQTPSRLHALPFLARGRGQLQWNALYMAEMK
jgi:hypothetical protein